MTRELTMATLEAMNDTIDTALANAEEAKQNLALLKNAIEKAVSRRKSAADAIDDILKELGRLETI